MNQALIKKFKKEFDHHVINDGKVLHCYGNDFTWLSSHIDMWGHDGDNVSHVIIDDQYVKERKAGAEGKQLQVSYDEGKHWYDKLTHKINWTESQWVRVKPEECKFKVGDWVIRDGNVSQVISDRSSFDREGDPQSIMTTKTNGCYVRAEYYKPWEPKDGEMVYHWDDYCVSKDGTLISIGIDKWREDHDWDYIAPVTHALPSALQSEKS